MKKGKADNRQTRAATGDSAPKELYSQSHFVDMQHAFGPMAFSQPDTYPELSPLPGMAGMDGGGLQGDCERRVAALADTVERERATIGVLEHKCEEYLSQLQRSADIIELGRDREDRERMRFEDKIEDLERRLDVERGRRQTAEEERDQARRQLDRVLDERGEGEGEVEKIKETLYKRDVTLNDQKTRMG